MLLAVTWVHLVAAVVWIGGMVFLSLILVPILRSNGFTMEKRAVFQAVAHRFRLVVWSAILILLVTGLLMLAIRFGGSGSAFHVPTILLIKLPIVALLIALTAAHDFWVGPQVRRLSPIPPDQRTKLQSLLIRLSPIMARVSLVLGLVVLLLGLAVART